MAKQWSINRRPGSVSTDDAAHNVYEVSYSYNDCSGAAQGLNGVQFTGLAFNSTNDVPGNLGPLKLMMVVTGASATAKYGILSWLIVAGFSCRAHLQAD